jgi:hypothetical protein
MRYLLYILYSLYLLLLLMTSLVPDNEYNSVWIVAILAFTTISFFQVSERYGASTRLFESRLCSYYRCRPTNCRFFCTGNPMKLRSKAMGQTPYVSNACVDTEASAQAPAYSLPNHMQTIPELIHQYTVLMLADRSHGCFCTHIVHDHRTRSRYGSYGGSNDLSTWSLGWASGGAEGVGVGGREGLGVDQGCVGSMTCECICERTARCSCRIV